MSDATPPVHKTFKLYVGGQFPRSESGRTLPLLAPRGRGAKAKVLAQVARASRKDLRAAAEAARKAFPGWASASALLRGQILHRMAELLAARHAELEGLLRGDCGQSAAQARREVETAADRLLWYAGWCDKLGQVLGTVNPVVGPYFNFSLPEPCGVICALPPARPALLGLVSLVAPLLVPGNTLVAIAEVKAATLAVTFAEICATSDLPPGVVNILTGTRQELVEPASTHREFDGNLLAAASAEETAQLEAEAADHVKRQLTLPQRPEAWWLSPAGQDLRFVQAFVEIKTAWHTMGR
jgi:acyl-CoA reductase-like NAD-dependent aldehyde dehydrogenase